MRLRLGEDTVFPLEEHSQLGLDRLIPHTAKTLLKLTQPHWQGPEASTSAAQENASAKF